MADFDPTSIGAVAVAAPEFDPASIGAVPMKEFDPASIGAVPVNTSPDSASTPVAASPDGTRTQTGRFVDYSATPLQRQAEQAGMTVDELVAKKAPDPLIKTEMPYPDNLGPVTPQSIDAPPSPFVRSAAASGAENVLETASGAVRMAGHAASAGTEMEKIEDINRSIRLDHDLIEGKNKLIEMRGHALPEDTESIKSAQQRIGNLESQKRAFIKNSNLAAVDPLASKLGEAGHEAYNYYSQNPILGIGGVAPIFKESTNPLAQIGRGAGTVAAMVPSMLAGPASLPVMAAQGGMEAYGSAYNETERRLRESGVKDEDQIRQQASDAASSAAIKTAPGLFAYMLGGKLAAAGAERLLPETAGVIAKTLTGFAGAAVANVATGTALRALEGAEWKPTIQTLTMDTLFAAYHGFGEWRNASGEVKAKVAGELARRSQLLQQATPEELNAALAKVKESADEETRNKFNGVLSRLAGDTLGKDGIPVHRDLLAKMADAIAEAKAAIPAPVAEAATALRASADASAEHLPFAAAEARKTADLIEAKARADAAKPSQPVPVENPATGEPPAQIAAREEPASGGDATTAKPAGEVAENRVAPPELADIPSVAYQGESLGLYAFKDEQTGGNFSVRAADIAGKTPEETRAIVAGKAEAVRASGIEPVGNEPVASGEAAPAGDASKSEQMTPATETSSAAPEPAPVAVGSEDVVPDEVAAKIAGELADLIDSHPSLADEPAAPETSSVTPLTPGQVPKEQPAAVAEIPAEAKPRKTFRRKIPDLGSQIFERVARKKGETSGGLSPDEAAQAAYEQGLISDPSPDTLATAIKSAWQSRLSNAEAQKSAVAEGKAMEAEAVRQDADFEKDAAKKVAGDTAIHVDELKIGDVVEVAGQKLAVIHVDPDGVVTLENHTRYGVQTREAGAIIYGEIVEEPAADFADVNKEIDVAVDSAKLSSQEATDAYIARHKLEEELSTGGIGGEEPAKPADASGQEGAPEPIAGAARAPEKVETPVERTRRIVETQEANLTLAREEGDRELAASLGKVLPKLRADLARAEAEAGTAAEEATPSPKPITDERLRKTVLADIENLSAMPDAAEALDYVNGIEDDAVRAEIARQYGIDPTGKDADALKGEIVARAIESKGAKEAPKRELWQVTRDQVGEMKAKHREAVKEAVKTGKPVPDEVLAEYSSAGAAWALKETAKRRKAAKTVVEADKAVVEAAAKEAPSPVEKGEFLKPGYTAEAPKSSGPVPKPIGSELLPPEEIPFNLVSETAADKAARLKREQADEAAKTAKDAAEAKALQDKQQTNLFDQPKPDKVEEALTGLIDKLKTDFTQANFDPALVKTFGKPVLRLMAQTVLATYRATKSAAKAIQAGIDYLSALGKDFNEEHVREFFKPLSDAHAAREAAKAPPDAAPSGSTALFEDHVNADRAKRGLEPVGKDAPITNEDMLERGRAILSENPSRAREITEKLRNAPPQERSISREDAAVLAAEKRNVVTSRDKAGDVLNRADATPEEKVIARQDWDAGEARVKELDQAAQDARSVWGGWGQFWQRTLREDFTFDALQRKARVAKNGPLSREEVETIKKQAEQIAELQKDVESKQKQIDQFNQKEAVAATYKQTVDDLAKATKEAKKKGGTIADFLNEQEAKAKARIIARRGKLFVTVDPLNIAGLVDEAIIGSAHIGRGITKFADWSKRMLEDFGERIRPVLKDLFDKAKELHSTSLSTFKKGRTEPKPTDVAARAKAEAVAGEELSHKTVYDLARANVNAGVHGEDAVMKAVHADIRQAYPDATERDVRRAFSEYGKVKFPSRDADKTELREIRTMTRLQESIDRLTEGLDALHTGTQRDKATQLIRDKQRTLNELLKKRQGPPSPEKLASADEAKQTALKNRIADLDRMLKTGEKPSKGEILPDSPAVEALKAERDAMQAKWDEIEAERNPPKSDAEKQIEALQKIRDRADETLAGKRPASAPKDWNPLSAAAENLKAEILAMHELAAQMRRDAKPKTDPGYKKEQAQIAALEKAIERYRDKTERSDFGTKGKTQGPDTARVAALKEVLASRKSMYDVAKKAGKPVLTPAERYNAIRAKAIVRQMADVQARLAAGDYSKKARPQSPVLDKANTTAKAELEKAKVEIQRGQEKMRLSNRTRIERTFDGIAKWRRAFVLTGLHSLAKLSSAAGEIIGIAPVEQAIGAGFAKALPIVGERAPSRGRFTLSTEGKAVVETFRHLMKDAGDNWKTGHTELDLLYGKPNIMPSELKDYIGRTHAALKSPAKRNEWVRQFEYRMKHAEKMGADPTDPLVQLRVGTEAYIAAQRAIFNEDNLVVNAYKWALRSLEHNVEPKTGKQTFASGATKLALKVTLPIVRIPTNIVARTFEYSLGTVMGGARTIRAGARGIFAEQKAGGGWQLTEGFRKGLEDLHPDEADAIIRNLARGSLGAAIMVLGMASPNAIQAGGYYVPGMKRKEGEPEQGGVRIFGHDVPRYLVHNPLLEQLQIGKTIITVAKSRTRHDPEAKGMGAGAWAAAMGLLEEVPFISAAGTLGKIGEPGGGSKLLTGIVQSAIPQLIQERAKEGVPFTGGWLGDKDASGNVIRRKPRNNMERLKMGIPLLRKTVPRA